MNLKKIVQAGHGEQLCQPVARVQQPDHAAAANDGGISADQLAHAGAIHGTEVFAVQEYPAVAPLVCAKQRFPKLADLGPRHHVPVKIEYRDSVYVADVGFNTHLYSIIPLES